MTDALSGTPAPQSKPAASAAFHYALVALLAGGVVFWRLGSTALEEHECRAALAARTMAEPNLWLVEGAMGEQAYEIPPNTAFNHWMVPVENGRPRLVKTPLEYWLVAWVAGSGAGVNEWTARLPAAIASVLCVLVTLALGRRMFSPRAALFGAAILATSFGFWRWGRSARPEMTLCLMTTTAMACFYAGMNARGRWRHVAWMAGFWVAMGLGNLSKEFVPLLLSWGLLAWLFWRQSDADAGPAKSRAHLIRFLVLAGAGLAVYLACSYGFERVPALIRLKNAPGGGLIVHGIMAVCLGAPMATYFFAARGWKPILTLLPTTIPGLAVMAALFLPWFYYMGVLFPHVAGGIFAHQVTERSAGTGDWHADPPYYYVWSIILYLLPWLAFLPGALAAPLMKRFAAHRGALMYLLFWVVGVFLLFTCAAGKREHYILPMIPAACLLMGFAAEDLLVLGGLWVRPWAGRVIAMSYGLLAPLGIVAALVAAHGWTQRIHLLAIAVAGGIPLVIGAVLAYRRKLAPMVACIAIAVAAASTAYYQCAHVRPDLWDSRAAVRSFAQEAARLVPPTAPVYSWEDTHATVPFYFGRYIPAVDWQFAQVPAQPVQRASDPNAAVARVANARRLWLADTNHAPWIFSYEEMLNPKTGKVQRTDSSRELAELGYTIAMSQATRLDKQYMFTLYHRTPTSAPASSP
jgi:4-amino-4-deoxy-L-arabinose transferase-like glycosyltransferase